MTQIVTTPALVLSEPAQLAVVAELLSFFTYEDLVQKAKSIPTVTPIDAKQFESAITDILSALNELGVVDGDLNLTERYRA